MADQQADLESTAAPGPVTPTFDVVRRGFDRDQVLQHLRSARDREGELEVRLARAMGELSQVRRQLADAQEELERVRHERDDAAEAAAAPRNPYEGLSQHVLELVRGFDQEVERLRRRAELDATGVMADARTEAARMRLEAQRAEEEARTTVERLLTEAKEEAERVRAQLAPLRELALSQARAIRERMRLSLVELEAILPDESRPQQVIVLEEPAESPAQPFETPPAP